MIRTKSVYHDTRESEDGYRLLVMRYWPRGVRREYVDGWMRELAPSADLLKSYREGGVDWRAFARDYVAQVKGTDAGEALLDSVEGLEVGHGTVTLLCHEDLRVPGAHCHRELLRDMLNVRAHPSGSSSGPSGTRL